MRRRPSSSRRRISDATSALVPSADDIAGSSDAAIAMPKSDTGSIDTFCAYPSTGTAPPMMNDASHWSTYALICTTPRPKNTGTKFLITERPFAARMSSDARILRSSLTSVGSCTESCRIAPATDASATSSTRFACTTLGPKKRSAAIIMRFHATGEAYERKNRRCELRIPRHHAEITSPPTPGNITCTSLIVSSCLSPVKPGVSSAIRCGVAITPTTTSTVAMSASSENTAPATRPASSSSPSASSLAYTGMKDAESTASPKRFWRKLGMRMAALNASAASDVPRKCVNARVRTSPMMRLRKIPPATSTAPPVVLFRRSAADIGPSTRPFTNFSLASDQPAGVNRGTGLELLDQEIAVACEQWQVVEPSLLSRARRHQRGANGGQIVHRRRLAAPRSGAYAALETLHTMTELGARDLDDFVRDEMVALHARRDRVNPRLHGRAQPLERLAHLGRHRALGNAALGHVRRLHVVEHHAEAAEHAVDRGVDDRRRPARHHQPQRGAECLGHRRHLREVRDLAGATDVRHGGQEAPLHHGTQQHVCREHEIVATRGIGRLRERHALLHADRAAEDEREALDTSDLRAEARALDGNAAQRDGLVDHRRAVQRLDERRPGGRANGRMPRVEHRDPQRLEDRAEQLHVRAPDGGVVRMAGSQRREHVRLRRRSGRFREHRDLRRGVAGRHLRHHEPFRSLPLDRDATPLGAE